MFYLIKAEKKWQELKTIVGRINKYPPLADVVQGNITEKKDEDLKDEKVCPPQLAGSW